MTRSFTPVAIALAALASPFSLTSTVAASDNYCGSQDTASVARALDGFYEVENGPGVLSIAGRTMALPAGNSSDAAIETESDGKMKIMSSQIGGTYDLDFYTGSPWKIARGANSPLGENELLTNTDLGVLAGCDPNELPRLFASGTYLDPDSGQSVDFKLFLFAFNESLLHGVTVGEIQTPNGPGRAQRTLTISR